MSDDVVAQSSVRHATFDTLRLSAQFIVALEHQQERLIHGNHSTFPWWKGIVI